MKVLLATKNLHKIEEIKALVKNEVEIISLNDLNDSTEVVEDGLSFEENSFIKASYYYNKYHINTISDDSGLCVEALNNNPGIYSSRYSGTLKDCDNINLLLKNLNNTNNRKAFFYCSVCYIDGQTHYFNGKLLGNIAKDIILGNGFGYDPIFITLDNQRLSLISEEDKNLISHRGQAFKKWLDFVKKGDTIND